MGIIPGRPLSQRQQGEIVQTDETKRKKCVNPRNVFELLTAPHKTVLATLGHLVVRQLKQTQAGAHDDTHFKTKYPKLEIRSHHMT